MVISLLTVWVRSRVGVRVRVRTGVAVRVRVRVKVLQKPFSRDKIWASDLVRVLNNT